MSRLNSLCSGTCTQVDMWMRDLQLLKKTLTHILIIMLACVDQSVFNFYPGILFIMKINGLDNGADLHKIGTCAGDEVEFHNLFRSSQSESTTRCLILL